MTFLEYSYSIDQVSQFFNKILDDKTALPVDQVKSIVTLIPPDLISKLPDGARGNASLVFLRILSKNIELWDKVEKYIQHIWDQPISGPNKTLGKALLNNISAFMMKESNSDVFISYSGALSKSALFSLTDKFPRLFISKRNYGFSSYDKLVSSISNDYTMLFNNYNKKL